jgi:hypothetical protein
VNDRTRAQLRRALKAIEAAMLDDDFVAARSPQLLGADIALAAVLLVKGISDRLLDREDYREGTRRLWTALFLGEQGMGEWRCSNTRRTISPRLAGVVRAFLCKFIRSPENR